MGGGCDCSINGIHHELVGLVKHWWRLGSCGVNGQTALLIKARGKFGYVTYWRRALLTEPTRNEGRGEWYTTASRKREDERVIARIKRNTRRRTYCRSEIEVDILRIQREPKQRHIILPANRRRERQLHTRNCRRDGSKRRRRALRPDEAFGPCLHRRKHRSAPHYQ